MRHLFLAFVLLVVLWPAPASAMTMPEASLEELVQAADGIVVGRVVAQHAEWNPARTLIFTRTTVEVEQTWKGLPARTIELTELGGEVDGIAMDVEGAPRFAMGERSVIFVHQEAGRWMTLRWEQGRMRVADEKGRRGVVLPRSRERVGVDELEQRVERLLRERGPLGRGR